MNHFIPSPYSFLFSFINQTMEQKKTPQFYILLSFSSGKPNGQTQVDDVPPTLFFEFKGGMLDNGFDQVL
jgi:hypothetical protein